MAEWSRRQLHTRVQSWRWTSGSNPSVVTELYHSAVSPTACAGDQTKKSSKPKSNPGVAYKCPALASEECSQAVSLLTKKQIKFFTSEDPLRELMAQVAQQIAPCISLREWVQCEVVVCKMITDVCSHLVQNLRHQNTRMVGWEPLNNTNFLKGSKFSFYKRFCILRLSCRVAKPN